MVHDNYLDFKTSTCNVLEYIKYYTIVVKTLSDNLVEKLLEMIYFQYFSRDFSTLQVEKMESKLTGKNYVE